jgi:hypothetical protein
MGAWVVQNITTSQTDMDEGRLEEADAPVLELRYNTSLTT